MLDDAEMRTASPDLQPRALVRTSDPNCLCDYISCTYRYKEEKLQAAERLPIFTYRLSAQDFRSEFTDKLLLGCSASIASRSHVPQILKYNLSCYKKKSLVSGSGKALGRIKAYIHCRLLNKFRWPRANCRLKRCDNSLERVT